MPETGWNTVTVPGAVSAWVALHDKFGKRPFASLFDAAIHYAREGYVMSPVIHGQWVEAQQQLGHMPDFVRDFLPQGRVPRVGETFRLPAQAESLEVIVSTKGEAFYRGELADKMIAHSNAADGAMTLNDLGNHQADWVECVATDYKDVRVHEIPPNGQGITALIALGLLRHIDIAHYPVDSADSVHLQMEVLKIAFAEAFRHVADADAMEVTCDQLLDDAYLAERAKEIDIKKARFPESKLRADKGTVYLTAADASGMMVSYIQSNYAGFGSGIVVPDTGISMQNRGSGFVLEPGHPNCVAGGKRPFHTIIPAFVTLDGAPLMSYGVMGGNMQAQGHVQMILRIFDYGQNPQTASDAPRWYVHNDFTVGLEDGFAPVVVEELRARGHNIVANPEFGFGGAQLIHKLDDGYCGASDHRKDGQAVGF
jgi:gamma-glutamyltranspeptidase/glutathione hydrolase